MKSGKLVFGFVFCALMAVALNPLPAFAEEAPALEYYRTTPIVCSQTQPSVATGAEQPVKSFISAQNNPTVYVYEFSAKWCPSCRSLKPIVAKIAARYNGFTRLIYVDLDDPSNKDLVAKAGIQAIPAIVVKDRYGRTLNSLVGLQQGMLLDQILNNYVKQSMASLSQTQ